MPCLAQWCPSMPYRFKRADNLRRKKITSGYTLIEMLVVVAIIGLLLALVGPSALGQLKSARNTTVMVQVAQLRAALDIYFIDMGRYPTEEEGLTALVERGRANADWNGPYLSSREVPTDPWGTQFRYSMEDDRVEIISLGADGKLGGEGQNADIKG